MSPKVKGFHTVVHGIFSFFFILSPDAFGHTVSGRFFLSVVAWSSFPLFIHSDDGRHLKPKLCTKWTVNHVRWFFFWMWHLKYWKIVVNRFVKNHHETRHVCLHAFGLWESIFSEQNTIPSECNVCTQYKPDSIVAIVKSNWKAVNFCNMYLTSHIFDCKAQAHVNVIYKVTPVQSPSFTWFVHKILHR